MLWYREQDPKVSLRFLDAVNDCIGRMVESPRIWPLRAHGVRRAMVRRFPYIIYFQELTDGVRIIAIVHGRRHPDVWRMGLDRPERLG
jgi:plasmid stabilization system protein ParE